MDESTIVSIAALGVGALLGVRFRRSRVVWAMASLGAAMWVFSSKAGVDLRSGAVVFLPWSLALLSLVRERGLATVEGIGATLGLAAPAAALVWLTKPGNKTKARWLDADILPDSMGVWGALSDVGVVAFLVGAAATLVALFWRRGALSMGFLAALISAAVGFGLGGAAIVPGLGAAGLILTLALVQETYSMAFLDELTRLPGRRALNEEMLRMGRRYTIAMLDVDHFKQFNDKYGHDVGDKVLALVASRMRKVKGGGRAFRYGGEEFTIVFPGRSIEQIQAHLEAVRQDIESTKLVIPSKRKSKGKGKPRGRTVSVTISIGAAQRNANRRSPEDVIGAADKALYRAKRKGRNQVHCAR